MSYSDEERNRLLSAEEIAALADDDYDADEDNAAALAELGRGDLDADDEDGEDDEPEAGEKKPEPDEPDPDAEAAKPEASQDDAKPEDDPAKIDAIAPTPAPSPAASQPAFKAEVPADYDEQLKANRANRAKLRQQLNDGTIDDGEYEKQLDDLEDARDTLSTQKIQAEIAAKMQAQADQNAWVQTIESFMNDAANKPELGIVDYRKDEAKQNDLDTFVKALGANPANTDKPAIWFLQEGHKRVVALHGIAATKTAPAVQAARKPDASKVVTNLAEVPGGAGDVDPTGTEFAEIDKLTGAAYERALSAMPPEKRERYLMSA